MYAVKNRYYKHSKLDEQCFRRILELFARDLTAVQCANETGVNVRSVNSIYLKLRDRIAQWSESNASGTPGLNAGTQAVSPQQEISPYLESRSDGVIGIRLFVHRDQIYCALLSPSHYPPSVGDGGVIVRRANSDDWKEYQVGVDVRRDMRFKLKSNTYQQAYVANDIERIDAFGRFLRARLGKFKGLRREKFYFHLKESEYRYNHQQLDLNGLLLAMLGESPIE